MNRIAALTLVAAMTAGAADARLAEPAAVPTAPVLGEQLAWTVYTGRWTRFFGLRVCWGQTYNLPGESQCI